MIENNLRLPPLIEVLVTSGRWPATPQEALRQNVEPLVSVERIAAIAPDEGWLYLYAPPFRSVASDLVGYEPEEWQFWREYGAVHELDPHLTLVLGDFGLGSDAPIILDYRNEPEPSVNRLAWRSASDGTPVTTWLRIAGSFDDFAQKLGLI